jgi:hypothetical protein
VRHTEAENHLLESLFIEKQKRMPLPVADFALPSRSGHTDQTEQQS